MENVTTQEAVYSGNKTKTLAIDAMFIALTFVFTAFVNLQVPSFGGAGGLIHLGNVPLLLAAMIFGKRTGALAGAIGMGLFDILSGWALWAPCTFITCGLMGFVVGAMTKKWDNYPVKILSVAVALAIKLAGYYIFESLIMGNGLVAALKSVPGNVIQVTTAGIIVLIAVVPLKKIVKITGLDN